MKTKIKYYLEEQEKIWTSDTRYYTRKVDLTGLLHWHELIHHIKKRYFPSANYYPDEYYTKEEQRKLTFLNLVVKDENDTLVSTHEVYNSLDTYHISRIKKPSNFFDYGTKLYKSSWRYFSRGDFNIGYRYRIDPTPHVSKGYGYSYYRSNSKLNIRFYADAQDHAKSFPRLRLSTEKSCWWGENPRSMRDSKSWKKNKWQRKQWMKKQK